MKLKLILKISDDCQDIIKKNAIQVKNFNTFIDTYIDTLFDR